MWVRGSIATMAAGIFLLAGGTLPAMAQGSCPDLYNRMMGAHQSFGPQSGQYLELYNRYTQRWHVAIGWPGEPAWPKGTAVRGIAPGVRKQSPAW